MHFFPFFECVCVFPYAHAHTHANAKSMEQRQFLQWLFNVSLMIVFEIIILFIGFLTDSFIIINDANYSYQ